MKPFTHLFLFAALAALFVPLSYGQEGVPITFSLSQDGYVTLVVEDQDGIRVRNLIQETFFPAGSHTVMWDGYDEGDAVNFTDNTGAYDIERHVVTPGTYRVRGLVHDGIKMKYELSVQSGGSPAWLTPDQSGAWLGDHSPPSAAVFLPNGSFASPDPQVMLGSQTVENGHGLAYVNLDGKKLYGLDTKAWRGAQALAYDRVTEHIYSAFGEKNGVMVWRMKPRGTDHHATLTSGVDYGNQSLAGGISVAAHDDLIVVTLPLEDRVVFVDGVTGAELGESVVVNPKGVMFNSSGKLFIVTENKVQKLTVQRTSPFITNRQNVITSGLNDPGELTLDDSGKLYVSDRGSSHQVKVFTTNGTFQYAIGKAGGPTTGWYDEERMRQPHGLAVDSRGQLWVAEQYYAPKRVSVWDAATGAFIRAHYGSPKYGGGGQVDPTDKSRFYYAGASKGKQIGMEFEIDWDTGTSKPRTIYSYAGQNIYSLDMPYRAPDQVIYIDGEHFLINMNNNATYSPRATGIWKMNEDGRIYPVGAVGTCDGWDVMERPDLMARWPEGVNKGGILFAWTDYNQDYEVQTDEVEFAAPDEDRPAGGFLYVGRDLSVMNSGGVYAPGPSVNADGLPVFDLSKSRRLFVNEESWGEAVMSRDTQWGVNTRGPIRGYKNGQETWSYHNQWPNRYEEGPIPKYKGQIVESARRVGYTMVPTEGEAGEVWALNTDVGSIHLLTMDGLYLAELGGDSHLLPSWTTPNPYRGMYIEGVSLRGELFWPTLTQADDGTIYFTVGHEHSTIVSLDGFESVERLDLGTLTVTEAMLPAQATIAERAQESRKSTSFTISDDQIDVDGNVSEWNADHWVTVDETLGITAQVAIVGDRLYAAYQTSNPDLLDNSGSQNWEYLFTTGGGLDLMLGIVGADTARTEPAPGDQRLFVTRIGDPRTGTVKAVRFEQENEILYADDDVTYDSPIKSITFDRVQDLSDLVELAQNGGVYEFSIPLSSLSLQPADGQEFLGDVGVVIGADGESQARYYWNNKYASNMFDVPTEAELTPEQWGHLSLVQNGPINLTPFVEISAPATATAYSVHADVDVLIDASDADGTISKVELFQNGVKVGEDKSAPYEIQVTDIATGVHVLKAVATDNGGRKATSVPVEVTVKPIISLNGSDVGPVRLPGSFQEDRGTFRVYSGGFNIVDSEDSFYYAYQLVKGDMEVVARITDFASTHNHAKVGLMIRKDLSATAPHAYAFLTIEGEPKFMRRDSLGGTTKTLFGKAAQINEIASHKFFPHWLKLVREGNEISAYESADRVNWWWLGTTTIDVGEEAYVGLAATGLLHNTTATSTPTASAAKGEAPTAMGDGAATSGSTAQAVVEEDGKGPSEATFDSVLLEGVLANAALPVELAGFEAIMNGETVHLTWATTTERNNAGFEVQRAALVEAGEVADWQVLDFVDGKGTTLDAQQYRFTDAVLPGGQRFQYRLKQIDFDGAFEYSPVVEVELETPKTFALHGNYPNPFNPSTTIRYQLPVDAEVTIQVFDALGREVATLVDGAQKAGRHAATFNAAHLASGVYLYRIEAGTFGQVRKMILLK